MVNDDVLQLMMYALKRGREMRDVQKEYFRTRTQSALTRSKEAEIAFDTALDNAAYAVKYGTAKPVQGTLL